jgi:hypothetical protein
MISYVSRDKNHKMQNSILKHVALWALLLCSNMVFGQFWFLGQQSKERYEAAKYVPHASLSVGAGSSTYLGDLLPSSALLPYGLNATRWNFGVQYLKHFNRHFSYKASLTLIRIAGDDNYYNYGSGDVDKKFAANYQRNLHFRNDLKELAVMGVYDLKAQTPFRKKRPFFSPFVFVGIAGIMSNPIARNAAFVANNVASHSDWVDLRGYSKPSPSISGTENVNYSPFTFAIPMGLGFRIKLEDYVDLGFEFTYRKSFSDYLDDVSDNRDGMNFTDITDRTSEVYAANTLRKINSLQTTNPLVIYKGSDDYFTTQVQLIFHIGKVAGRIN